MNDMTTRAVHFSTPYGTELSISGDAPCAGCRYDVEIDCHRASILATYGGPVFDEMPILGAYPMRTRTAMIGQGHALIDVNGCYVGRGCE